MRTRKLTPIPQGLLDLAAVQEGLLSAAQCTEQGVSSARRSRLVAHRRWQHVTHGIYDTDPTHPTARVRPDALDHLRRRSAWIALLACGPTSVAVGSCALALLGVRGLPLHIDPEAALPGGRHAKVSPGVQVRCYELTSADLHPERRCVTLLVALAQALPGLGRYRAVAVLDGVLNEKLLRPQDLPELHDLLRGRPGAASAHVWFSEVDGRSESVLESFARLECVDAGVPPDELQHRFFDTSDRFLGRADLVWKLPGGRWLVVEIDGDEFHSSRSARSRDAERQNGLVSDGIVVLRYTYDHLRRRGHVGGQVRSTLARLGRPATDRERARQPPERSSHP